jgi:hypothetical protein
MALAAHAVTSPGADPGSDTPAVFHPGQSCNRGAGPLVPGAVAGFARSGAGAVAADAVGADPGGAARAAAAGRPKGGQRRPGNVGRRCDVGSWRDIGARERHVRMRIGHGHSGVSSGGIGGHVLDSATLEKTTGQQDG